MIYAPYDPDFVATVRAGGPDANGQPAELAISDGAANPCRSCLNHVPAGAGMLIVSARPFPAPQPYAEQGPIFLCAETCRPWDGADVPPVLRSSPDYLVKGYSADNRIVYGTGQITEMAALPAYAAELLARPDIAFVDIRSARNNCFLTRVTQGHLLR